MPETEITEPPGLLTARQWASLRDFADLAPEIIAEWPRVKAGAAHRKGIVDWYNGVVARNPKIASAMAAAVGAVIMAGTAWLMGFVSPKSPPEVAPVVVPVEKPPAPPAEKSERPARQMPAAPISSKGSQTNGIVAVALDETPSGGPLKRDDGQTGIDEDAYEQAKADAISLGKPLVVGFGCSAPGGSGDWINIKVGPVEGEEPWVMVAVVDKRAGKRYLRHAADLPEGAKAADVRRVLSLPFAHPQLMQPMTKYDKTPDESFDPGDG